LPAIQKDLQFLAYQQEELHKLTIRQKAMMAGILSGVEGLPAEERQAALKKLNNDMIELEYEAYNILIPFQRLRIDQIRNQNLVRASEPTAGLTHQRLVTMLGLTESQLQSIREKARDVDAKLREKVEKLRKEIAIEKDLARRELLALLTEDQRKLYYAAIGEMIDLTEARQEFVPRPATPTQPTR
jgi:hypothetical protein